MIVQHNITSMNANRQLGIVGNNLAKSTEKLSSGSKKYHPVRCQMHDSNHEPELSFSQK